MRKPVNRHEYLPFEVNLSYKTTEGYPVTVHPSPAGDGKALCHLNPSELQDALKAIATGQSDALLLAELGNFLFNELFVGELATLYRESLAIARGAHKLLRIRLQFEPPELTALPWEYLFDGREDGFLATSSETALVRYVPMHVPVRPTTVKLPLRILVVISNPHDLQLLNVEKEMYMMREALADRIAQGQMQLEFVERATIANINQAMRSVQPHIFHFVGHAQFEQSTNGTESAFVALEDEHKNAHLVNERTFSHFFAGCSETRVAVLNACQTAMTSTSRPLVGLAPRLLQHKLSAVVAMQFPIPDRTALIFGREFYRSIALGYPVDAAISEARKAILQEIGRQSSDWGIPVLFLRAQDGQLFEIEPTDMPSDKAVRIETGGGAQTDGNIAINGGDFYGRDTTIHGDAIRGDQVVGPKTVVNVSPGAHVTVNPSSLDNVPAPPELERPPRIERFVGRHKEITYYTESLARKNLAMITGLPGVGKSVLAAQIVKPNLPERIFWYTCKGNDDVQAIIWKFAAFLASRGSVDVWHMLNSGRLPDNILLNYLFQPLAGKEYLLCIDDLHCLTVDPRYDKLIDELRQVVQRGEAKLILISRETINFGSEVASPPLDGLNIDDARQLLLEQGLLLEESLLEQLYAKTKGNAQLLSLAAQALQQPQDKRQVIERLIDAHAITNFLLELIDKGLNDDRRAVMRGTAALLGWPGTADAIEETLGNAPDRVNFIYLTNRYLLQKVSGERFTEYDQHAIIQEFYYGLLNRRQRIAMHERAAKYYEQDEPDKFRAALHYSHANQHEQAVRLATTDVRTQLYRGRARALVLLLENLSNQPIDASLWAAVRIAQGQCYDFMQQVEQAQTHYEEAWEQLALLDATQKTQVCRGLGVLLRHRTPAEALRWLQRGLDALSGDPSMEADLLVQVGVVQTRLGDLAAARNALDRALELAPPQARRVRWLALINLGSVHYYYGELAASAVCIEEALAQAKRLKDPFYIFTASANLANLKFTIGQWQAAQSLYAEALQLAEKLGNRQEQIKITEAANVLLLRQGDHTRALAGLTTTLEQARKSALTDVIVSCSTYLAELCLLQGKLGEAANYLAYAEQLVQAKQMNYKLPFFCYVRACYYLATDEYEQAKAAAEQGTAAARTAGMQIEQGLGLRALGQVELALQRVPTALAFFVQSVAQLEHCPYEAARTRRVWGKALQAHGDQEAGLAQLSQASAIFKELGANNDARQDGESADE